MARTLNHLYENDSGLIRFIENEELYDYPNVLIQIFSGERNWDTLRKLTDTLKELMPMGVIIGCTTRGELADGRMYQNRIIISVTTFEKTEVERIVLNHSDFTSVKETGKHIVKNIGRSDSKLAFLYAAGSEKDIPSLIQGIQNEVEDLTITGGVAGQIGDEKPFVFTEEGFIEEGVVAAVLHNADLKVTTYENQKWSAIGADFIVTRAKENIIYSINGKKPMQLLKNYLGETFTEGLPDSSSEFPLLKVGKGIEQKLFIKKTHSNGAIEMSDTVKTGEVLTFSYVNLKETMLLSEKMLRTMTKQPIESIFLFYDLSRIRLLKHFTEAELAAFRSIGDHSGFISFGRFFEQNNRASTADGKVASIVAISENDRTKMNETVKTVYEVDENMKPLLVLSHLVEVTTEEIKGLNKELGKSEQYFKSLFENNTDFVFSTDLKGRFTRANKTFLDSFGFSLDEIIGQNALKLVNPEDVSRMRMNFMKALKGKIQYYKLSVPNKSGALQHFQVKNIPITIDDEIVGIYGIGRNISEQIKIEEQLVELAYYDPQTGLPNRTKFTDTLKEQVARAKKKKRKLSVVFIDIDRFKIINDSLGHYAGDLVLKRLAERIKNVTPSGTYLGRFAGDKFTIILTKEVSVSKVRKIAEDISTSISKPIVFDNQEFFITSSTGVCMFPADGEDADSLLKNADIAMNKGKTQGGNKIIFYSNEMNEQARHRLEMESGLRKAVMNDEFFLCYQPLIDLKTGKIYGSEALIRWEHPEKGLIPPSDFIPLAEETGIIEDIGSWVLNTACKQNKKWQEDGHTNLKISVNVSAYQFQQPHFVQQVKDALEQSGLQARHLHLELTETAMIVNLNYSISTMKELQNLGVKVSIDDFGTGYSSLSYLKDLPIDYLKIDRSFINNLKLNTSDIAIVKAIITMGHGLSVKVVAEGVETEEQINLLKQMDCHYAQGFYINKPLRSLDFEKNINKQII